MEENIADNSEQNYTITTQKIYFHARDYWERDKQNTSGFIELGNRLQSILQEILLKYSNPIASDSNTDRSYLLEKVNYFERLHFDPYDHPLRIGYFMTGSNKLTEPQKLHEVTSVREYLYLYDYAQKVIITKTMVNKDHFELLFSFSLVECDIMNIDSFLNYHLENNFNSSFAEFSRYLSLLIRKYGEQLFKSHLCDCIKEWIDKNMEKLEIKSEKIKTYLTVDKLSYLFRILVDDEIISSDNKAKVIRFIADNFESKERESLSFKSVENKFHNPTDDAMEFWEKRL